MTDVTGSIGSHAEIPAALMSKIVLPLSGPNNFVLVRGAVERFNKANGQAIDPIDVAGALIKKGYNIVGIPARKIEIKSTPEGLVIDREQILQIVKDDRLGDFPVLKKAVEIVRFVSFSLKASPEGVIETLGKSLLRDGLFQRNSDNQDPRKAVENYLSGQVKYGLFGISSFFSKSEAPNEESEKMVARIVEQGMFLLEHCSGDQLYTKSEQRAYEQRHIAAEQEERDARRRRREELFVSQEAAERWLFGVARHAHREARDNPEIAAMEVSKNERASALIAHHKIDLFGFVDRQIAEAGKEGKLRNEIGRVEGPLAVLLTAFAKPRTRDIPPQEIRKDPGGYLHRLLLFWLDAKFVSELPEGAYGDSISHEDSYQERYRSRTDDYMRRDSFYGYGPEADTFFEEMANADKERASKELRKYEASRVAVLWWRFPTWVKWKLLRRYIEEELRKISAIASGFSARKFLDYIDGLVARENQLIKQQNILLGSTGTNDPAALEQQWRDLMKLEGDAFTERFKALEEMHDSPAHEKAQAVIRDCEGRIQEFKEMRDFINLYFVMSPAQREAEILRLQRERFRWRPATRFPW